MGALLLAVLALGGVYAVHEPRVIPAQTVVIEPGMCVSGVARMLDDQGVVWSGALFKWTVKLRGVGEQIRAGEYQLPERASIMDLIDLFMSGRVILHRLTIPEGITAHAVVEILKASPFLQGEIETTPLEGTLLPETYTFPRGTQRQALLKQMQEGMRQALQQLWTERDPTVWVRTPEEALILASIVEKETSLPSERARVAGVFYNRLRIGMPLQSDPTVRYGLNKEVGVGLSRAELKIPTPYNTYLNKGLTPTPIANPGIECIRAVLHPEKVSDIYFVANGEGGHTFAVTLAHHQKNHQKWRKIRLLKTNGEKDRQLGSKKLIRKLKVL